MTNYTFISQTPHTQWHTVQSTTFMTKQVKIQYVCYWSTLSSWWLQGFFSFSLWTVSSCLPNYFPQGKVHWAPTYKYSFLNYGPLSFTLFGEASAHSFLCLCGDQRGTTITWAAGPHFDLSTLSVCNEKPVSPHSLNMLIHANICLPQYSPWGKAYML